MTPELWHLATKLLVNDPIKTSSHRMLYGAFQYELAQVPNVDLATLGFVPRAKMTQLKRNYWNPSGAARIREHLAERKSKDFTSLTLRLNGQKKSRATQGYCITNLVISHTRGDVRATVQYRSTEIFCKHIADWTFLNWVYEQLEIEPISTTFQIANCYATAMFFPSLFMHVDPVKFLDWLERHDRSKLEFFCNYYQRMFADPDARSGFSAQRRQHAHAWRNEDVHRRALRWMRG